MSSTARVVVGVNGSPASRAAVAWAAEEAGTRAAPVLLVHTWTVSPSGDAAWLLQADEVRQAEAQVLVEAGELLRSLAPGVEQDSDLSEGRPDTALVRAGEHASLLVLGRHSGSSAWLGPVLGHVSVRSGCPVVAVPADHVGTSGSVVVGVDGSSVSQDAVAFAFGHASRRGAPLVAVLAVDPPFGAYLPSEQELDRIRETGRRHLSEALAGWSERYPDVRVSEVVSLDAALPALLEASAGAALLVVGSHGRGALLRAALGSVSSSLLRSAPCPLAVVRPHPVHAEADRRPDAAPTPLTHL
jgi:nucleotide-binding universal stress UspA family protein